MQQKDLLSQFLISGAREHHATERSVISSPHQWRQAASFNRKICYHNSSTAAQGSIMQQKGLLSQLLIIGARQHHAKERSIISSPHQWRKAASCNRKIYYQ
jgi:hypothetical protein